MADEAADPHVLGPGMAPTPFTAEEIRDGCSAGRTIRIQVDIEGQPPTRRINTFIECDEQGANLRQERIATDGAPLGEMETNRVTWDQLQGHASFPADQTTIEAERLTTPMGDLDCLRYTVTDGETEDVFWFAKDLPGMPIKYQTRIAGQVISTVSVLENGPTTA